MPQLPAKREQNRNMATYLQGDHFRQAISAVMPRHLSGDRFARIALTVFRNDEKLAQVPFEHLAGLILEAAQRGYEIGIDAHLVAFWSSKKQEMQCSLIPDYRGLVAACRRSGQISDIYANVVYEGERFEWTEGLSRNIIHEPSEEIRPGTPMRLAYAVAKLKDGTTAFYVCRKHEIEEAKASSSSGRNGYGPWRDNPASMWKKTACKRLTNLLPQSAEMLSFNELDDRDRIIKMDSRTVAQVIPEEFPQLPEAPQANEEPDEAPLPPEKPKRSRKKSEPKPQPVEGASINPEILKAAQALDLRVNQLGPAARTLSGIPECGALDAPEETKRKLLEILKGEGAREKILGYLEAEEAAA